MATKKKTTAERARGNTRTRVRAEIGAMLRRIIQLADRSAKANTDPTFVPGFEVIAWAATDLLLLVPPPGATTGARAQRLEAKRQDVIVRHAGALAAVVPASLIVIADAAFEDAAELGRTVVDADCGKHARTMSEREANAQAVDVIRERLSPYLGTRKTDAEILAVVRVYRKPRAKRGRPIKGEEGTSQYTRSEALAAFLGLRSDPRDLSNSLGSARVNARERVERLIGHSAKPGKNKSIK